MNFTFDLISFFIGLLAGFAVSFVLYRLRHSISLVREQASERAEQARDFATRTADSRYQIDLYAFCQRYHLGGKTINLADVLVEPRFIHAHKPYDNSPEAQRNVFRVVPMIHEFPACYAPYNIQTLGIADLGASERHMALLGQSGSGRSTALAAIALWALGQIEFHQAEDLVQQSIDEEEAELTEDERLKRAKDRADIQARALEQIKRAQEQAAEALRKAAADLSHPPVVNLRQLMPILVHLGDVTHEIGASRLDPAEPLVRAIQKNMRRVTAMTMPRYVYNRLNSGQALVLLDGFDDLPEAEQQKKIVWLRHFLATYPECTVIVAGPVTGYHPLTQLGLTPIFLRPWNDFHVQTFVGKWAAAWPKAARQGRTLAAPPDEATIRRLQSNTRALTPLDLTMRLLDAFSNRTRAEESRWAWFRAFVQRGFVLKAFTADTALFDRAMLAMADIAKRATLDGKITLQQITDIATAHFRETPTVGEGNKARQQETFILDVGEFTKALTQTSGLMRQRTPGAFDFLHPQVRAFLASEALLNPTGDLDLVTAALDPIWLQTISFAAARAPHNSMSRAVVQKLSQQPDMLFSNLFELVYWLPDAPSDAPWRGEIFKRLAAALIAPGQFPAVREYAVASLVTTRDSNTIFILRRGLRTTDTTVRRLACIGLGALGDSEAIKDLRPMLEDDDLNVQLAAGLALGAIGSDRALEMMVDGLLSGEEGLRQAVAEALAAIPGEGHQTLHAAITHDDMLVRRAAVFGLARVQTPWALADMYRALIEDSQWYVRSAAEQAFAEAQQVTRHAASAHPPLQKLVWLADWAEAQGKGEPTEENAAALLMQALREGTPQERIACARTLGLIGEVRALRPLYVLLNDGTDSVRAAAFAALADLQMQTGQHLPGLN